MAGLQRSAISFRRQGSSGVVWEDKLVSGELDQQVRKETNTQRLNVGGRILKMGRTRSVDRGFRAGRVSPSIEPPSPRLSACGCCGGAFGGDTKMRPRPPRSTKRVL